MITPDTKNWTWVLDAPCPECGFDARGVAPHDVAGLVRANAREWRRLHDDGLIVRERPDDTTWSPLEYECHVRDVYLRYDARVALMVGDDDPLFPNWDQDETAVADRYGDQDAALVTDELERAAERLATRLDGLDAEAWSRPGRRSDGSSFTVGSLVRYMVHDTIHHVWDVTRT